MDNPALLIFVLVALLLILVFVWLSRAARKASATRHLEAENLGFHQQDLPDPGLVQRINRLHQHRPNQNLQLKQVFFKPQGETSLYIFDMQDTSGEDDSLLLDGALAVISPRLELPRFGLFPKVPGEGFLAQAANQVFERLIGHQAPLIDFDDRPDFDRRFLVTGEDSEQVRHLLSDYLQDRLSAMEMLHVEAGFDILVVANVGYAQMEPDQRRDLETLYRQTLTLFDLLRRGSA